MKKALTTIFVLLSLIIILDSMNAGHAIFMFFLAGIIPGTNTALSAGTMLEAFTFLIGFTLSRVALGIARLVGAQPSKGTILSAQS